MLMTTLLLLALIIVAAHLVETVTGFGATVIALALAIHLVPLHSLVVTLVILGWVQSAYLIARGWRHIDAGLLLKRVLPLCGLGLAAGAYLFNTLDAPLLKRVLGVFVIAVAAVELWRLLRRGQEPARLNPLLGAGLLAGGGVIHGMFASGGPLIVYHASREIPDKQAFRVTLSALWITLNTALLISYAASGRIDVASASLAAKLLLALAVGVVLGELVHRRVDERRFRLVVQGVLLFTGAVLLV